MIKQLLLSLFVLLGVNTKAQDLPAFKQMRYDEDYLFLKNDSSNGWYKRTKYNAFKDAGRSFISFGGDVRFQYFNIKNEDWGEAPPDKDGFLLTRFLVHADFHAGKHFRTFVQL